jgi:hypothetical protein
MAAPQKSFQDYPTYYPFIKAMQAPVKIASDLGLIPSLLYSKFFA